MAEEVSPQKKVKIIQPSVGVKVTQHVEVKVSQSGDNMDSLQGGKESKGELYIFVKTFKS
jgi:hypothetical protein